MRLQPSVDGKNRMTFPPTPHYTSGDPAEADDDSDRYCDRCGGEGVIMAWEGDGSDWGEDTYNGPMDAVITCRACGGTGMCR